MKEVSILIIDDHEDDLILFREMLEDAGYTGELVTAGGAREARNYLENCGVENGRSEVGLILLDLNMPIKNGFEFIEELKGDPDFKKIPVIIVSGSRREVEREMALAKGAIAYVTKPLGFEDLVCAIQGLSMSWSLT